MMQTHMETAGFDDFDGRVTPEDMVHAVYAALMESKRPDEQPTLQELDEVCDTAQFYATGQKPTGDTINDYRYLMNHPFARLWGAGVLEATVYFEWAHAKEVTAFQKDTQNGRAKRGWL
ncbi:MAG: hypothetical protein JWO41_602 [Candidatus Saccharibacteria bacterium]|nr:hypothetical protein [Candidatus Saccharibacteria bacterium]